ncbi:MAG TPA: hypothetical protein ENJ50_07915, partial [Planctomycetaceae bacterium]|nr:hypothetical protein [Planctomycetaceae bacterium]
MRAAAGRGWWLLLWVGLLVAPAFAQPTSSEPADVVWESAWQKKGFRIIPYGSLWADMIYASERTHPGAYTLFVFSRQQHGEPAFTIDARRTRLGANIEGPPWDEPAEVRSGGRVEIDFHGNFVTENKANVLLRHAYWELTSPTFRVLVGQTWDVVSPLLPGTLNYSVGWAGGNIGFRRTQFRLERYWKSPRGVTWILQGALAQDIVADFPTDPGVRRESSDWPVLQFRAAIAWPSLHSTDSVTVGASGHWGESGFDFLEVGPPPLNLPPQDDVRIRTWSWNIDIRWPLGERAGFQGEFFHGSNLSSFLGGIGQGVCPCVRRPIR